LIESFQVQALFILSARPRMRLIVYLGKMLKIKVSIDLGCTDSRVPHKFLNGAEVLT